MFPLKSLQILLQTLEAYTKAYNFCCSTGFQTNTKNGIVLHQLTYSNTRDYLPSQLAISARMVATESLKSVFSKQKKRPDKTFKCPSSKRTSVRLDKNSHTIWFEKSLVSILTTQGRLRLPFKINKYFSQYLDWKHTSCTLTFKNNKFFLNVVFEKDVADISKSGKYLGIDRGIRKLAVTLNAARNIVLKHLDSKAFFECGESDRAEVNQPNVRLAFGEQGTSPCL